MAKIDFDVPQTCKHCGGTMMVWMPILITPGSDKVDVSMIDYESSNAGDSSNWVCDDCGESDFPVKVNDE